MKQILVSQDEILISESGGFDFSRYEGMIADTINSITDDLRKNITDDSSSITEIKEIITGLKGNVDKISSKVNETKESISNLKESQSNKITNLESKFDKNKAETISKIEAISSPDSSIASKLDELKSKVHNNSADIILLQKGTTTETGSIATQLSNLKAQLNNTHSELTSKIEANATNDTARASKIEELKTRINDLNANYSNSLQTSVTQLQGKITTISEKTENLETKINNANSNALSAYTEQIKTIAKQEAGKVVSTNTSKLSSLESALNSQNVSISHLQDIQNGYIHWRGGVESVLSQQGQEIVGFKFGASSQEQSYFNIFAKDINLVSNGKKIIGVQNGQPYIDGNVIRLDSSGDFYETRTVVIPRTSFEPGAADNAPHIYSYWFNLNKRGFYLVQVYSMSDQNTHAAYIGITHVGYSYNGKNIKAGARAKSNIPFVKLIIHKYGL